ncbi:MAG TPA: 6,7-dimethyl-8-ribityllumazine synthase, partial [Sulfitobacter sp.]|nr:6,7-dimethyl-8-ribityllumazine synthase [Sulfitobacter sp.]
VLSVSLTPHHYQETDHHNAIYRDHFVTKGREAAQAALRMTQALETFSSKENGAEISKISAA